jgi:G3E family GTPase
LQILETSGVADPEDLALTLRSSGFRLDAVVAVIDAEAAAEVMKQAVALKQVNIPVSLTVIDPQLMQCGFTCCGRE